MWITSCFGKNYHRKFCENIRKRHPDESGKGKIRIFYTQKTIDMRIKKAHNT